MRPSAEAAYVPDTQRNQRCPLKTSQKISPEEILVRKVPDIRYDSREIPFQDFMYLHVCLAIWQSTLPVDQMMSLAHSWTFSGCMNV